MTSPLPFQTAPQTGTGTGTGLALNWHLPEMGRWNCMMYILSPFFHNDARARAVAPTLHCTAAATPVSQPPPPPPPDVKIAIIYICVCVLRATKNLSFRQTPTARLVRIHQPPKLGLFALFFFFFFPFLCSGAICIVHHVFLFLSLPPSLLPVVLLFVPPPTVQLKSFREDGRTVPYLRHYLQPARLRLQVCGTESDPI